MSLNIEMVKLRFLNLDAEPKNEILYVSSDSVDVIMRWYGPHFAGDRYLVFIDGKKAEKDIDGEGIAK